MSMKLPQPEGESNVQIITAFSDLLDKLQPGCWMRGRVDAIASPYMIMENHGTNKAAINAHLLGAELVSRGCEHMTKHFDSEPKVMHGRLFLKYGGYFERDGDACMPAFHDAHDGPWVYTMLPEAFISKPDAGCTARHIAGCTPEEPASLSVKIQLPGQGQASIAMLRLALEQIAYSWRLQPAENRAMPTPEQIQKLEFRWMNTDGVTLERNQAVACLDEQDRALYDLVLPYAQSNPQARAIVEELLSIGRSECGHRGDLKSAMSCLSEQDRALLKVMMPYAQSNPQARAIVEELLSIGRSECGHRGDLKSAMSCLSEQDRALFEVVLPHTQSDPRARAIVEELLSIGRSERSDRGAIACLSEQDRALLKVMMPYAQSNPQARAIVEELLSIGRKECGHRGGTKSLEVQGGVLLTEDAATKKKKKASAAFGGEGVGSSAQSTRGSAPKKERKKETKQRASYTSRQEMQRLKDALAAKGLGTTGNAQQLQARLS